MKMTIELQTEVEFHDACNLGMGKGVKKMWQNVSSELQVNDMQVFYSSSRLTFL